jgi:hypothetical protein
MIEVLQDALKDSIAMIPWLLGIYFLLELVEWKLERWIKRLITFSRLSGPLVGALLGCLPQCGFSAIAAVLYAQRFISLGTLLAVFLSTSDEAIPVILAQPEKIGFILPILGAKIVIAVLAGYLIDLIWKKEPAHIHTEEECVCETAALDDHCCGKPHADLSPKKLSFYLIPLRHTAEVFFFILAVCIGINLVIFKVGEANLGQVFLGSTVFQPLIAALIGLIPNCAASVAITEVFLKGGITFGSAIAGLSASAGIGMLVLLKENKDRMDTLRVVGLLVGISFLAGLILNSFK